MASACLFIGWDGPRPGRDQDAYGHVMRETLNQLEHFRSEGWCESCEMFGLTPHCGTLNAFILLKGERAKLDELRRTDAFERFSMHLGTLFTGYGVLPGVTIEGMLKVVERNPELFK